MTKKSPKNALLNENTQKKNQAIDFRSRSTFHFRQPSKFSTTFQLKKNFSQKNIQIFHSAKENPLTLADCCRTHTKAEFRPCFINEKVSFNEFSSRFFSLLFCISTSSIFLSFFPFSTLPSFFFAFYLNFSSLHEQAPAELIQQSSLK